ncbi:MAG: RNA-binding transcriptional accessory protein, partial [Lachnospiraceae bacterium]|nr:RNA-binding transcriptional accessory protein [Lachnospiraceae bacterium]
MDIYKVISEEVGCLKWQVEAAVKLIDDGNTIPFISRYRKEMTGSLDDSALRMLSERLEYLRNLEARKEEVIALIEEQGKLTDDLKKSILKAEKLVTVEDLYRPYKQKKKTRADMARKRGLEPFCDFIMAQNTHAPLEEEAQKYVTGASSEKDVPDVQAAIAGASDIIAERISDDAAVRERIRDITRKEGLISSKAKAPETDSVYTMYYDFAEPVKRIAGHRILAINRGESEGILSVSVEVESEHIISYLKKRYITAENKYTTPVIIAACEDAYSRLIQPSIEREIRTELKEKAEESAIKVFEQNLYQLLMQPPIVGCTVLGWDPAFRTGCKTAVVDETGKVLDTVVVYPTAPHNKVEETAKIIKELISKHGISVISVGNGTASRESEQIIVRILKEIPDAHVQYVITNEAGASVYSASKLASEEFPNFDVGQRSAVSIARRIQDPLAELVKIDPKSIGVGQYQHDMNQKKLGDALDGVVEDAVNKVGVDLNTASASLLSHISGITAAVAKNIVSYREEHGRFVNRKELMNVAKLGPKAYEQCAGFCRITGGDEPLDATGVHPESYKAAKELLKRMGCGIR